MLILIAHGSRDPRWRESVEKLVESLQASLGADKLRLAYMQFTPPTLIDVASEAIRAGATRIRVLPLFLTGEGHLVRDIRPLVDQLCQSHPTIDVRLLPPVGRHPLFEELLGKIAREQT